MKSHLLILHGALGSKAQFSELAEALDPLFQVHTMNFEGHGGRVSNQPFSMDVFAENVLDYMNEKGISSTHIFGYSMGGYVALKLAKSNPRKIDRIVTLGTKLDWSEEVAQKETSKLIPEKIAEKVPQFAAYLERLHQPQDWQEITKKTATMMLGLAAGDKLVAEDFQSIDHPILIGLGDQDNMVTEGESQWAANLLPNGSFHILNDCQHPIEQVNKQQLAGFISHFVSQTS